MFTSRHYQMYDLKVLIVFNGAFCLCLTFDYETVFGGLGGLIIVTNTKMLHKYTSYAIDFECDVDALKLYKELLKYFEVLFIKWQVFICLNLIFCCNCL